MPSRSPVGDIWRTNYQVEYAAVDHYVRLWDRGHNGSLWFHPSSVINILPVSRNINTSIQTPDGEVVLVAVFMSGRLLKVYNGWLNNRVRPILCVSL